MLRAATSSDPGWRLPRAVVEHVGKGHLKNPPVGPLDKKGGLHAQRLRVQREIAEDPRVSGPLHLRPEIVEPDYQVQRISHELRDGFGLTGAGFRTAIHRLCRVQSCPIPAHAEVVTGQSETDHELFGQRKDAAIVGQVLEVEVRSRLLTDSSKALYVLSAEPAFFERGDFRRTQRSRRTRRRRCPAWSGRLGNTGDSWTFER